MSPSPTGTILPPDRLQADAPPPTRPAGPAPAPARRPVPLWLHLWAILTLLAASLLVLVGAEVTTKQVGMVDPVGFRLPWLLFSQSSGIGGPGLQIEHGH